MRKTRWIALALALCMVLCLGACASAKSDIKTYSDARNGVAVVATALEVEGQTELYSYGSGFFVDTGDNGVQYLVTNYHVVSDYLDLGAGQLVQVETDDGDVLNVRLHLRVYLDKDNYIDAQVLDSNSVSDVAIVKLERPTDQRKPLALRAPDDSMVGSKVYAIGYPGAADSLAAVSQWGPNDSTFTTGSISRLVTEDGTTTPYVQIDAVISHGNSGGPLVDEKGTVLGINVMGVTTTYSDGAREVYYALNVSEAIALLKRNGIDYIDGTKTSGVSAGLIAAIAGGVAVVAVVIAAVAAAGKKKGGKANSEPPKMDDGVKREPSFPKTAEVPPVKPPVNPNDSGLRIQATSGALAGKRFMLRTDAQLILGRDSSHCNVVFPIKTPGVSNQHCAVWVEKGKVYIRDLSSSHGTFLPPGMRLSTSQSTELHVGDSFFLGSPTETFVVTRKGGV